MSEFKVNTITNKDGSHGPQICGITTFGGSGMQLPSGPTEMRGGRGRGIAGGGSPGSNTIAFVTIASTGNAEDFGDLSNGTNNSCGCAGFTRGVIMGGNPGLNNIDYVSISSQGGVNEFGDLSTVRTQAGAVANHTRGIHLGGQSSSITTTKIEYITFATTGDASGFGDFRTGWAGHPACLLYTSPSPRDS